MEVDDTRYVFSIASKCSAAVAVPLLLIFTEFLGKVCVKFCSRY